MPAKKQATVAPNECALSGRKKLCKNGLFDNFHVLLYRHLHIKGFRVLSSLKVLLSRSMEGTAVDVYANTVPKVILILI